MRKVLYATVLTVSVLATGYASASEDAINARRGYFQLVKLNFGTLAGMAKGAVPYDAAQAAQLAANLDALTSMDVMNQYPEGSEKGFAVAPTRAASAIWTDTAGFAAKYADFQGAVDGIVAAAGSGQGALGKAVGATGATCKGCHEGYRAQDF